MKIQREKFILLIFFTIKKYYTFSIFYEELLILGGTSTCKKNQFEKISDQFKNFIN